MADQQIDTTVEDLGKSILTSKTMWASVVLPALTALVPPVAPFIAANPQTSALLVGVLMAALRWFTNKPLAAAAPKS